MPGKRRRNRAKAAVLQPRFRSRVARPAKGAGAYRRKPRRPDPQDDEP